MKRVLTMPSRGCSKTAKVISRKPLRRHALTTACVGLMGCFRRAVLTCAATSGLIALAACGAGGDSAPNAAPADVTLAIAWNETLAPTSIRHVGHNAVWSRGGLGLWDEQARAVKEDVRALVEALRPGVLRWPGGARAMAYHFDETIGPVTGRSPQCDTFTGMLDATSWGMDEALTFAESIGAQLTLVTPWHDGTPQRAAAMVAYANADPASTVVLGVDANGREWGTAGEWAARRVANGHAAPYDVPFLEVGNEQYLTVQPGSNVCGTDRPFTQAERVANGVYIPSTARDVATQVALTARAVKAVDPTILVGVPALSDVTGAPQDPATAVSVVDSERGTRDAWNPTMVELAGAYFDFWVVHTYSVGMDVSRLRLADEMRHTVERLRTLSDHAVAVTEFGTFFDSGTLMNALLSADFVRVAVEERLLMNLRHLLIEDLPSGLFATSAAILGPEHRLMPGYHAMRLMSGLRALAVPVTSSEPNVAVLATSADDRAALTIAIIDRRYEGAALTVRVPLPAGRFTGELSVLSGLSLMSDDSEVTIARNSIEGEGFVDVTLPLHGLLVIDLTRRQ